MTIAFAFRSRCTDSCGGPIPLSHLADLKRMEFSVGVIGDLESVRPLLPNLDFYLEKADEERLYSAARATHASIRVLIGMEEDAPAAISAGWHFCDMTDYAPGRMAAGDSFGRSVGLMLDLYARVREQVAARYPDNADALAVAIFSEMVRNEQLRAGVERLARAMEGGD